MLLNYLRSRLSSRTCHKGPVLTWNELYKKAWINTSPEFQSIGREMPDSHFINIAEYSSELLNLSPRDLVLDAGCDSGLISFQVSKRVMKLIGVDFVESFIKNAVRMSKDSNKSEFMVVDCQYLPFKDNVFDKVLAYDLIHGVDKKEEGVRMLQEMIRVTKPRGKVLIGCLPDRRKRKYWRARTNLRSRIYELCAPLIPRGLKKLLRLPVSPKWIWYDFSELQKLIEGKGCSYKVVDIPPGLHGDFYRSSIVIQK